MKDSTKNTFKKILFFIAAIGILFYLDSISEERRLHLIVFFLSIFSAVTIWHVYKGLEKLRKYRCIIKKDIYTNIPKDQWDTYLLIRDGNEATIYQEVELPFTPYPGLHLQVGKLKQVFWGGNHFVCHTAPYIMDSGDPLGVVLYNYVTCGEWCLSSDSRAENALKEWRDSQNKKTENSE